MKRINAVLVITTFMLLLVSCKKDQTPPFSATGFWSGFLSSGPVVIDFLNRPDGTNRVYLLNSNDTATAYSKLDGTYTVMGSSFQSQVKDTIFTIDIRSLHTTVNTMDGILFLKSSSLGELLSYPFEVIKQ
jgi:hypothetical protein